MQAGFIRYGEEQILSRRAGLPLPSAWSDDRAAESRIRPTTGQDALALSRLYATARRRHPSPVSKRSGWQTGSARALTGECRARACTPILRFADVEAYVEGSPDGGKDGTELDGFLQVGVAKEDQPHYLKIVARPGADMSNLVEFGLGVIGARTTKGGDHRHEHGVIAPVRTYESPVDRRLEEAGFDFDRQRQSSYEGNARSRRRAGPCASRRALTRFTEDNVASDDPRRESIDDLDALLGALPPEIVEAVHRLPEKSALIEVVMDLGRRPEARFPDSEVTLLDREIVDADLAFVVERIGSFGDDNRAGIERTLHRISAIRNRNGKVVGLTCRIGRAVYGTIEIINDFVETGKSILIMGRPGIGKTTMLREAARVLADDMGKRVVVVDTSNEIAGDGDIPHPAIGKARRMQVRTPSLQHEVMIEAVENHMPQVIVIDEIGTELEAQAARTIAERGVQLIGTAHGNNLDNLMLNPTLSDLIGGIQSVTLGDEEARRRRTQKSVLERKAPPTFDVIVEIVDRERVTVHADVADTVDAMLRGDQVSPELRWRDEEGVHRSQGRPRPSPREQLGAERFAGLVGGGTPWRMEPGWRGDGGNYRGGGYREAERGGGFRPGYRPGAAGGWRQSRGGSGREPATRGPASEGGYPGTLPGERFASPPAGRGGTRSVSRTRGAVRRRGHRRSRPVGARRRR